MTIREEVYKRINKYSIIKDLFDKCTFEVIKGKNYYRTKINWNNKILLPELCLDRYNQNNKEFLFYSVGVALLCKLNGKKTVKILMSNRQRFLYIVEWIRLDYQVKSLMGLETTEILSAINILKKTKMSLNARKAFIMGVPTIEDRIYFLEHFEQFNILTIEEIYKRISSFNSGMYFERSYIDYIMKHINFE